MGTRSGALVSVIIPTYYRNNALREAILSVLAQTYEAVEVIVVDDSGEDHARPVADEFEDVEFIALDRNRGANRARAVGFKRARGSYVHFLDDDDRMFASKLERQMSVHREKGEVGVVYCGIKQEGGRITRPEHTARGDVLARALAFEMWPCMTSTMLIDATLIEQILPFPDLPGGDDLDMMIKLAKLTNFDFVDAPLLVKRIQEGSRGHTTAAIEGRLEIIEAHESTYSRFPRKVRNQALARTYEDWGRVMLLDKWWSARAIVAMTKQYYYSSWTDPTALAKFVASLFGRPGFRVLGLFVGVMG